MASCASGQFRKSPVASTTEHGWTSRMRTSKLPTGLRSLPSTQKRPKSSRQFPSKSAKFEIHTITAFPSGTQPSPPSEKSSGLAHFRANPNHILEKEFLSHMTGLFFIYK